MSTRPSLIASIPVLASPSPLKLSEIALVLPVEKESLNEGLPVDFFTITLAEETVPRSVPAIKKLITNNQESPPIIHANKMEVSFRGESEYIYNSRNRLFLKNDKLLLIHENGRSTEIGEINYRLKATNIVISGDEGGLSDQQQTFEILGVNFYSGVMLFDINTSYTVVSDLDPAAGAHLSPFKSTNKPQYAMSVVELEKNLTQQEKIKLLRQNLKQTSVRSTLSEGDIRVLQKQYPALAESISDFTAPIKAALLMEFGDQQRAQANFVLEGLVRKLYEISQNTPSLGYLSEEDPIYGGFTHQMEMSSQERLAFEEEKVFLRVQDLSELLFLLLDEAHSHQGQPEVLAEALRVTAEIYLVIGKNKGSVARRQKITQILSALSTAALFLTTTAATGGDLSTVGGIIGYVMSTLGLGVTTVLGWPGRKVYTEPPMLPILREYDVIKAGRELRDNGISQAFDRFAFLSPNMEQPEQWTSYLLGLLRSNRKLSGSQIALDVILKAGGDMKTSNLLQCAFSLSSKE